jgi:hypothetical protein
MTGKVSVGLVATSVALGALAIAIAPVSTPIDADAPKFDTVSTVVRNFALASGTLEYVSEKQCFALRNDVETYTRDAKLYAREKVRRQFVIWPRGTRAHDRDGVIELALPEGEVVRTGEFITAGGGAVDVAGLQPPLRCTGSDSVFVAWTAEPAGPSPWRDRIREAARTGTPLS